MSTVAAPIVAVACASTFLTALTSIVPAVDGPLLEQTQAFIGQADCAINADCLDVTLQVLTAINNTAASTAKQFDGHWAGRSTAVAFQLEFSVSSTQLSGLKLVFSSTSVNGCFFPALSGGTNPGQSVILSGQRFTYQNTGPLGSRGLSHTLAITGTLNSSSSASGSASLTINDPTGPSTCSSLTVTAPWIASKT
ncbi:MAG: hypothetical protein ABL986_19055 [Vicinamibacterales bacterium]